MTSAFQSLVSLQYKQLFLAVLCLLSVAGICAARAEFIHPGGLHAQADLDRMKTMVAANQSPWIDGWNRLLADTSTLLSYNPGARANMGSSRQSASRDAHAAYNAAIRWYVSGDTAYADKAVQICNAWSSVVNQVPTGTDIPGLSGIPIFEFAMVGELLRIYPGWDPADFERFKDMMLTYWYPVCHDFLTNHNGTCVTHWWANWDACNIGALVAIGVLCDNEEIFQEGIDYYLTGPGSGSLLNAVPFIHPNGLGQWQESGRDQEHAQLGVGLLASMCEIAWKQGVDLYGLENNRLLAGAEYVARTNLSKPVPFTFYNNCDDVRHMYIATNGIGRLDDRPVWEMIYNHYVVRQGLSAPNVKKIAELMRPEHGSADHFGYGTLTFSLDAASSPHPASPIPPAPEDVEAEAGVGAVRLSWSPLPDDNANGYRIQRSTTPGGPYETIASWHENTWPHYWDGNVVNGQTYYYVVAANNQSGTSPNSVEVSATPQAEGALPGGWAHADVGTVSGPGSAGYAAVSGGSFIVRGGGSGIGGTADSIGFTYGQASGDCTLTARLIVRGASKVGLMMRESLEPDAKAASVALGDIGWRETKFGTRASTGGEMTFQLGNAYTWVSVWYRLQRTGNTFTAAQSLDGVEWHTIGSSTIDMASSYVAGFLISSGNLIFDHVQIDGGGTAPATPAGLVATGSGSTEIDLSWEPSAGATSYVIKRAANSAGPFETIASGVTGNSYSDTNIPWETAFYYTVSAGNLAGVSADSTAVSGTTQPPDIPPAPEGVIAVAGDGRVTVSWQAAKDATIYELKRAIVPDGPYTALTATGGTDFTDLAAANGTTYYYVVSAGNYVGIGPDSAAASATPGPGPYSYWPFNETEGTTATDVWGDRNGTLGSGASFAPGAINNGVHLNGSASGNVTLPAGLVGSLTDFTICAWVKLDATANWVRVFDFGTGTNNYMFLSPRRGSSGNGIRYAIRTPSVSERGIDGPAIAVGEWAHLAVTQAGTTGILYLNGLEVARNSGMTLNPSSLGHTTQNWIGKSQWPDPPLNGTVDDFRIYNRALTAAELAGIVSNAAPAAPTDVVATADGDTAVLSWSAVPKATGYNVRRATVSGGPYTTIASNVNATSYLDETAAGGVYYYVITTRSGAFESAPSSQASVVLPPTGVLASSWNGRVDLSWRNANGATGYVVKRATSSGGPFETIATPTVATFSDTGLSNGTTYYYVASATTTVGVTPDSMEVSGTPFSDPAADAWNHGDVGSVGFGGNTSYAGGVFTLHGGGADIWFQADGFQFAHQTLSGDGAIMARVLTQENTSGIAKAGVMIRENLNTNSRHVLLNHTPNNAMEFIRRTAPSVNAVSTISTGAPLARWVRLVRSGNSFTAYHSADGFPNWTPVGTPQTISMGTTPYVGLVVCAGNNSVLGQATFDHVDIATAAPVITSATTATGTFGAPFSYTIEVTNTASIYGATGLPVGLDFNADTGVISGMPGATGTFEVTLGAINAMGSDSRTLTVAVLKSAAAVALGELRQYYDGTPRLAAATTDPAELDVDVTYDGSETPPIFPGEFAVVGTINDANFEGSASGTLVVASTALVRHAPVFNGDVDGSVQVLLGENVALNSSASVSGDLLVPGTPNVQLNGQPIFVDTLDGPGDAAPANYTVTLNSGAVLRYVVRRVDPIELPGVDAPPAPSGTRDVSIDKAGQSAGDFATLRNLTLNSKAGTVAVPPGTYGWFTVNGTSVLVLGVAGAEEPAIYNLQGLTLNNSAQIQLVGPVKLTLANGSTLDSSVNVGGDPDWLTLRIAAGGLTLNSSVTFNGHVVAPAGTVTLNSSTLEGSITSDGLTLNGSALLLEPAP